MSLTFKLPFLEDFYQDTVSRSVVCIGCDKKAIQQMQQTPIFDGEISHVISIQQNNYPKTVIIQHREYSVLPISYLEQLVPEKHIILISSSHVEVVKEILLKTPHICNQDFICYNQKIQSRNIYADENIYQNRIVAPYLYWHRQSLVLQKKTMISDKMRDKCDCLKKHTTVFVPRVIVPITTRCNLCCLHCIALTDKNTNQQDLCVDEIISDLKQFFALINECACLEILGGEPFLHPKLYDILDFILSIPQIQMIQITTNGLICPEQNIIELLKSPKLIIRISDYGYIDRVSKLIRALELNHINFVHSTDLLWLPLGEISFKNKSNTLMKDEYAICYEGIHCKTIFKGKVFQCTFASRLWELKYLKDESDTFDLHYDSTAISYSGLSKKLDLFLNKNSCNACNYCELMDWGKSDIKAGQQPSNKKIVSDYRLVSKAEYNFLKNHYIREH